MVITEQNITSHIAKYSTVDNKRKDVYGEVMTPAILINELLDSLPKSVWTNPDLTWLDPCAGTGNFSLLIYRRLMTGLSLSLPNETTRHSHILTNMLFMVELNSKNSGILRDIFGKRANIWNTDFLTFFSNKQNPNTFNIIIGNPPYQITKKSTYSGAQGSSKTLWTQFITLSLAHIHDDGYLAFITPANWRRTDHPLYDLMTRQHRLRYLHIYGKDRGLEIFGVQTRFDVYVIQNSLEKTDTIIIDEKGKTHRNMNLAKWPFLPNYNYNQIQRILVNHNNNPSNSDGMDVIYSASLYDTRRLKMVKSKKYRCPIIHNMTKKGRGIRYSSDTGCDNKNKNKKIIKNDNKTKTNSEKLGPSKSQYGIPKVILNFNEKLYPYNDYLGEYGMSQITFGIRIKSKDEGERIISGINSPAFQEIIRATKWGAFQTDYRMFSYFRKDFYDLL